MEHNKSRKNITKLMITSLVTDCLTLGYHHPIIKSLVWNVIVTTIVFCFSFYYDNNSVYDPYWSIAPIPLAFYFAIHDFTCVWRNILVVVLVAVWGLKFTIRRGGLPVGEGEDWRYLELRKRFGKLFWIVSYFGTHLFCSVLPHLALIPCYVAVAEGTEALNWMDLVASVVTLVGIYFEWQGDNEVTEHRRSRKKDDKASLLTSGLFRYTRHPNYFGEISFWYGLVLFAIASQSTTTLLSLSIITWISIVGGAVGINSMFVFITIPWMEQRLMANKPEFRKYTKETSRLIPWFVTRTEKQNQ